MCESDKDMKKIIQILPFVSTKYVEMSDVENNTSYKYCRFVSIFKYY